MSEQDQKRSSCKRCERCDCRKPLPDAPLTCVCGHPGMIAPGWRVTHTDRYCMYEAVEDPA